MSIWSLAGIGRAYHDRLLIVALDYDLIENETLLSNPGFTGLKTQFVVLAAEFNAFDFVRQRVGIVKDLAGNVSNRSKDTALTADVWLCLGFNLDATVTYPEN